MRLEDLSSPDDLRDLSTDELDDLAGQIRTFLVQKVSRTGGHLGPNLGVVELTLALHRVFDSPSDVLLWDTGHQSYVHKILTGARRRLRLAAPAGGLSGYPRGPRARTTSSRTPRLDRVVVGGRPGKGVPGPRRAGRRHVVAIIGDGALTGGMAWEALNNIAGAQDRQVIIVVNDNERSYSPDDRRPRQPSVHAAHHGRLRELPGAGASGC